jgi:hypothetical protein
VPRAHGAAAKKRRKIKAMRAALKLLVYVVKPRAPASVRWPHRRHAMFRNLVLALALAAVAAPAAAQNEEPGGFFGDEVPAPPQEFDDSASNVDVSVDATPGAATVTLDTFQQGLSSHGEWVDMPPYGRVWRPTGVAAGWRPYYYGRWEWTDEGWLWVSDEPWGWATYHYGRWAYDNGAGWVWVPGYQWAPAWVTWRYSPDYIGWAPLGPGFSVYVTSYPVVYSWWTFVPCTAFVGVPVYSVGYTGAYVRNIWHYTRPAPPRAVVGGVPAPAWGGPARPFIEHRAGRPIVPVRVQPVASPAAVAAAPRTGSSVVPIYRPEVRPAARGVGGGASAFAPGRAGPAPQVGAPAPRAFGGQAAPRPIAPQPYGVRPSAPAQGAAPRYAPAPQGGQRYTPAPQGGAPRYAPAPQGGARPAAPQQMQNRWGGPTSYQPRYGAPSPRFAAPAPQFRGAPAAPQGHAAPQAHGGGGHRGR